MSQVEKVPRTFDDWLTILRQKLPLIGSTKNLAFAASCCQRALPNYQLFAREVHWGNCKVLTEALAVIWRSVVEEDAIKNKSYVAALLKAVDEITPDTETPFESLLTSAALDAAASISESLTYILDRDTNHVLSISSLTRDTIYLYIQYTENADYSHKDFDETILHHPLMMAEIIRQQHDLETLESSKNPTPEFWNSFRENVECEHKSNLGLSV